MKALILYTIFILFITPVSSNATLPPETGSRLVNIASSYSYVREYQGNNRSPEIDSFLKDLGLPVGLAWCMAYVQRCWKDTSRIYKGPNPMPKGVARVSTFLKIANQNPFVWRIKTAKSLMNGSSTSKVGDMTIHISGRGVLPSENFNGHIEIVSQRVSTMSNWTWGGNTGPETAVKSTNVEAERNASGKLAGVHHRYRNYAPNSNFRIHCLIEPITAL
jgi:hypothetical protein